MVQRHWWHGRNMYPPPFLSNTRRRTEASMWWTTRWQAMITSPSTYMQRRISSRTHAMTTVYLSVQPMPPRRLFIATRSLCWVLNSRMETDYWNDLNESSCKWTIMERAWCMNPWWSPMKRAKSMDEASWKKICARYYATRIRQA